MNSDLLIQEGSLNYWIDGVIKVGLDGLVRELNKTAEDKLGWSLADLQGKSVHSVLCEQSIYTDHEELECPLVYGEADIEQGIEAYWTHKNQTNIAVSYRVRRFQEYSLVIFNTCETLGVQVDELKKLSVFTEINPAPLLELDELAQIQFSNPSMTDLMLEFGFNDEGVPNVLPADVEKIISEVLANNKIVEGVESLAVEENNPKNISYFLWSFHPIENANKPSVLLCGIDITSKKEMEIQKKAYERTLEEERKKARKEYLAKMVHELRSPLNAVVGYANILKMKLSASCDEKQVLLFDRIIDGGNQLADQISSTLESSRVESGKMQADIEHFDSIPILKEVYDKTEQMAAAKGLSASIELPDGELKVLADKQHVKQIVINLISNAIKYTDNGVITLHARNGVDPVVGRCVVISIIDTGCGVPDEQKDTIFDLFQRQDDHEGSDIEGDGLGLAICVEMIELSHGRITLEDNLGGSGSVFSALLPR